MEIIHPFYPLEAIEEANPGFYEHLQKRMELEDRLLSEIRACKQQEALQIYRRLEESVLEELCSTLSSMPELSFLKSYCYSLNFLCRQAAHQEGVPITALYAAATRQIARINRALTKEMLVNDNQRMVMDYISLIQNLALKSYSSTVKKIVEYIFLNMAHEIQLKDLADHMKMTPSYLSGKFKKETGESIMTFVTKKKIDYACSLLINTSLPIQEIAQLAGYKDAAYFTRVFRRQMGSTPSGWRRQNSLADPLRETDLFVHLTQGLV